MITYTSSFKVEGAMFNDFNVSKYPYYNIEKWTTRQQTEVDVSNIFKSLLSFTRFVKWDIVHEDEPLNIKARNDLGLNEF